MIRASDLTWHLSTSQPDCFKRLSIGLRPVQPKGSVQSIAWLGRWTAHYLAQHHKENEVLHMEDLINYIIICALPKYQGWELTHLVYTESVFSTYWIKHKYLHINLFNCLTFFLFNCHLIFFPFFFSFFGKIIVYEINSLINWFTNLTCDAQCGTCKSIKPI